MINQKLGFGRTPQARFSGYRPDLYIPDASHFTPASSLWVQLWIRIGQSISANSFPEHATSSNKILPEPLAMGIAEAPAWISRSILFPFSALKNTAVGKRAFAGITNEVRRGVYMRHGW